MTSSAPPPVALSIAGSDSGGGAGLQADLKTWEAFGVFGATVVTCVTAQNTRGVQGIAPTNPGDVRAQLRAVFEDLSVAAVKTGLLPSSAVVREVAVALRGRGGLPLVVDPVLVATSGDSLAGGGVASALLERLLPLSTLVTPNLDEVEALTGRRARTLAEMRDAASVLVDRGAPAVLVKGGHLEGAAVDVLLDAAGFEDLAAERLDVGPVHGTGCTLSAAIAAGLARGAPLRDAVAAAKRYVHDALRASFAAGGGARVLRHARPRR